VAVSMAGKEIKMLRQLKLRSSAALVGITGSIPDNGMAGSQ
jgi:hypothetical protein